MVEPVTPELQSQLAAQLAGQIRKESMKRIAGEQEHHKKKSGRRKISREEPATDLTEWISPIALLELERSKLWSRKYYEIQKLRPLSFYYFMGKLRRIMRAELRKCTLSSNKFGIRR